MLVAVAAMAFTACQNEPETVINNGNTTVVFNPILDETRSYFGEKVAEGYPSSWSGNEVAKFNHWTSAASYENIEVAMNGEGRFSVTFNALSEGNTVDAYVPAASWGDVKTQWDGGYNYIVEVYRDYTIPAEQNPTATSVDEKAHILKASTTYEGGNTMDLYFEHQAAYGKLSLKNYEGGEISQYAITIDGKMYVVNSTLDTGVWFACNPVAEVQNMSISVVAADGTYSKTLIENGDETLGFVAGQVSTFVVDMAGITTGEAVDTFNPDVLATNIVWDGGYYKMTGETGSNPAWAVNSDNIRIFLNEADRPNNNSIIAGTYTGSGNNTPAQGQFGCRMSIYWGTVTNYNAFGSSSTLDVKFADNVYTIVLTHNGTTYGYKGLPDGWTAPGKVKTALATPEVTAQVVDDKNVTVTWNEVANAANYTVSVNGVEKQAANTSRNYTIEGTYATEYTITVVANPAANSEDYKESAAGSATVTTNADPNAEEPEQPEQPAYKLMYYGDLANAGLRNEYVMMNDARSTLVFFSINNGESTTSSINAGTYTYSSDPSSRGTIFFGFASSDSKIDNTVVSISDATLVVEGNTYTLTINNEYVFTYSGAIL